MRSRPLLAVCISLSALASLALLARDARAQDNDRFAGGLRAGNYVRVSGGVTTPVNPQGSFRDWSSGTGVRVSYENWQAAGSGGVGRLGVSFFGAYSFLPLDEAQFLADFTPLTGGKATSGSAGKGGLLEAGTGLRIRIPAPFVAPMFNIDFGFINWRPSKISYEAPTGNGVARQQSRSGVEIAFGAGVDRVIAGNVGIFADANYVYGLTSLGRASTNPGGICGAGACDVLKNTPVTELRAGLSVRTR